ncbi:MAG: cytochrome B [Lewinellaceae bacterium]|nr:cytochrome B [Lewinellaceae bacterium]
MYTLLDNLHSYNRYLLFAALLLVLYRSWMGWMAKKPFEKLDGTASLVLLILTHTQLLLGLLLYAIFSPTTKAAFANMGAAMKDSSLRYFAVEHILAMLIAVVFIQLGRTFSKKAGNDEGKHRALAIYTSIAVVIILVSLVPKGLLFGTSDTMMMAH